MKVEARSSLVVLIALVAGFALGMFYQQRTDEHKWFMSELRRTTSIQQVLDTKISNAIKEIKNGR